MTNKLKPMVRVVVRSATPIMDARARAMALLFFFELKRYLDPQCRMLYAEDIIRERELEDKDEGAGLYRSYRNANE